MPTREQPVMGRVVWFAAGAGAGVYAMVKARRAAEALTPEGLADRLAGLSVGAHLFGEEVRAGMAEKETELRQRLGLALHGTHQQCPEPAGPRVALAAAGADEPRSGPETREGDD